MKFLVTMNMPSNQGRAIHQMIVECEGVTDVKGFWSVLSENMFILVNEFYYQKDESGMTAGVYRPRGSIIINTEYVGKVRQLGPNPLATVRFGDEP